MCGPDSSLAQIQVGIRSDGGDRRYQGRGDGGDGEGALVGHEEQARDGHARSGLQSHAPEQNHGCGDENSDGVGGVHAPLYCGYRVNIDIKMYTLNTNKIRIILR